MGEPMKPKEWNSEREQEQYDEAVALFKQGDKPRALEKAKPWPKLVAWIEKSPPKADEAKLGALAEEITRTLDKGAALKEDPQQTKIDRTAAAKPEAVAPKHKNPLLRDLDAKPKLKPQPAKPEPEKKGPLQTEVALKALGASQSEPKPKVQLPAVIPQAQLAPLDDALALMNSRHAILENVGGKTVIACWELPD